MTTSEFSLIDQFFKSKSLKRNDVTLGIGDDAAVTDIPEGMQLVSAVDTLVSGVHFSDDASPFSIGYKSLAVNLSDLAAMGAQPAWATLALTLPESNESWVREFSTGFFQLAEQFDVQLIGGDTTQGPLTVTVQVMGLIPKGQAITRSGAKVGDSIYVTGTLGDAAAALYCQKQDGWNDSLDAQHLVQRLDQPSPRIEIGIALRGMATAAIDVSDGFVADLNHILDSSGVGATLMQEQLPISASLLAIQNQTGEENILQWALYGGDDYELCFTVEKNSKQQMTKIAEQLNIHVTEVGVVESQKQIRLANKNVCTAISPIGYQHFSKT